MNQYKMSSDEYARLHLSPKQQAEFDQAKEQGYLLRYPGKDTEHKLYNSYYEWCKENELPFIVVEPEPRSSRYAKVKADLVSVPRDKLPSNWETYCKDLLDNSKVLLKPDTLRGWGPEISYATVDRHFALTLAKCYAKLVA